MDNGLIGRTVIFVALPYYKDYGASYKSQYNYDSNGSSSSYYCGSSSSSTYYSSSSVCSVYSIY